MLPTSQYSPESHIVYDQLAASYLLFAAVEILVPRITEDVGVGKTVVLALLLGDAGHMHASWVEMGTRHLSCPWMGQENDVITMVTSIALSLLRAAFLLEDRFVMDHERKEKP
jgi:hypothetical protein